MVVIRLLLLLGILLRFLVQIRLHKLPQFSMQIRLWQIRREIRHFDRIAINTRLTLKNRVHRVPLTVLQTEHHKEQQNRDDGINNPKHHRRPLLCDRRIKWHVDFATIAVELEEDGLGLVLS